MEEVLKLALSFPSVVYTVFLGVVIVYWTFVMIGAIELGEGSEGALDGGGDADFGDAGGGHGDAGGGHGDAGGDGGDGGDADGGDADGDGTTALAHHHPGALAAVVSALRLRKVPATAAISLVVTFSWLSSVVAMQVVTRNTPSAAAFFGWIVLFLSPIAALPLAAIVIRPLSTVFVSRKAPSRADLVGKICVVRTGKVTHAFGEGTLGDGGAGLVVRLRIDGNRELRRGDQALIVEWDAERDAFVVEPMKDVLAPREPDGTNRPG